MLSAMVSRLVPIPLLLARDLVLAVPQSTSVGEATPAKKGKSLYSRVRCIALSTSLDLLCLWLLCMYLTEIFLGGCSCFCRFSSCRISQLTIDFLSTKLDPPDI